MVRNRKRVLRKRSRKKANSVYRRVYNGGKRALRSVGSLGWKGVQRGTVAYGAYRTFNKLYDRFGDGYRY